MSDITSASSSASADRAERLTPHALVCVALLTLLGFSLGCSEFVVIGIETELAETFGVSIARVGELISFFSITYAVCTPLLAIATGRFKRFQLLAAYAVIFILSNIAMAFAPSFELLLAARVLLGAVSGALLAVGVTFIPELVGVQRTSMMISIVYAAFSVAMVISTSAGKMIAETMDWHVAMMGVLVLAVVTSVALLLVLPRSGSTDEPATMREQAVLFCEPQILTGMAIFIFGVGSVYVFYGYVTPYLETILGMDALGASTVLMAYGVACFFSNLLSGWFDARVGMKALLASFLIQAALLFALFLLGPTMPAALAIVLLIGLSMYVVSVPCISLFMRVARQRHPKALTLASSLEPMSFNTGIAFGTAVGGAVVSGPGMAQVGLVGGAFSLVALALVAITLLLDRRTRRQAA
ncbi:MFS transporter [Collinsella sp. An2]|uniref:MFS transporter n=1 Tax=Collinsella sp. An2 TaxID=1965585 RepID=UPI000B3A92FA|nr:MFS transporter [Collinsella sp. An2]OUP11068.1 MFS transporter [Collinsella sp. An2]